MRFGVVLDTNVLLPSFLRDVLLELAAQDLYRPLWSSEILAELESCIWRQHRVDLNKNDYRHTDAGMRAYIERLFNQMQLAFPEALTELKSFHPLGLPDPKDEHVVACAVAGHADTIVTANLRDFPATHLPPDIETLSPHEFLLDSFDLDPEAFIFSLGKVAQRSGKAGAAKNSFEDVVSRLTTNWCPQLQQVIQDYY